VSTNSLTKFCSSKPQDQHLPPAWPDSRISRAHAPAGSKNSGGAACCGQWWRRQGEQPQTRPLSRKGQPATTPDRPKVRAKHTRAEIVMAANPAPTGLAQFMQQPAAGQAAEAGRKRDQQTADGCGDRGHAAGQRPSAPSGPSCFGVLPATAEQRSPGDGAAFQRQGFEQTSCSRFCRPRETGPASSPSRFAAAKGTQLGNLIGLAHQFAEGRQFRHPSADQAQHRQHQARAAGRLRGRPRTQERHQAHRGPRPHKRPEQNAVAPSAQFPEQAAQPTRPSPRRGAAVHCANAAVSRDRSYVNGSAPPDTTTCRQTARGSAPGSSPRFRTTP